jgi:multidrug resistance efflux pump
VQPGEVIQAGMTAVTLAKLDTLTVTVFISEDRYGEVRLGDSAALSVDSFPGKTFTASVTRIADQAEYTPRNVQTKEERQTTVFAVELSVENPEGDLKPGMPVDVTFE